MFRDTHIQIDQVFSFFLARVRHRLLRKVSHRHFLAAAWSICQQNKMWKNYISVKVITFSKQLVIIYHVALHWTKMLFSAWLLEVIIYIHKSVKNSSIYLLCCLIGENNTPCWNTDRFALNKLTCRFSDICTHLLISKIAYRYTNIFSLLLGILIWIKRCS